MEIRPFQPDDLPHLIALTIETFGPFYEDSFRSQLGDVVFSHQHGSWREDYRSQVPALHDPDNGRVVAVADSGGSIVGYVAWKVDTARKHGEIDIVAVSADNRRHRTGTSLCEHALANMKAAGVEVVALGTGGDRFHAPARALYEKLGFTSFPGTYYFKAI
jgi:ribosomal protein S18 acetylase RimI-like enzyme